MRSTVALAAWVATAVAGVVVGGHIAARHGAYLVDAAPFAGHWDLELKPQVLAAVAVAVVVIALGPRVARLWSWSWLLVSAAVASTAWAVSLAATVGWHGVTQPMYERAGYLTGLPELPAPAEFLRTFTSSWREYRTHIKGHPPGFVLVLWVLDRVGLSGAGWAAVLVLAASATTVVAVLLVVGEVAGRDRARAVAPFLVLAPAAVWLATSADALFAATGAWAVFATVRASRSRRWIIPAGVLWAATLLLSYGLVLLAVVPAAVLAARRSWTTALAIGGVAVACLVGFGAVTGFWWQAGLAATRRAYWAGVASKRPAWLFLWLNVSALAFAVGPVIAGALARARRESTLLLPAAALVAVALADLSLMSKGEVERIWLPWVPWILVAAAFLPVVRRRMWLAAQAATGIGLQLVLRSPW